MKEAKALAIKLSKLKAEKEALIELENETKAKLLKLMDEGGDDELEFSHDGSNYRVKSIDMKKVKYDVEKLKEKLDKKVFNSIVDKKVSVDYEALKALFKERPSLKKVLSDYLNVSYTLSESKMNDAYKEKMLTVSDLKGCYEIDSRKQLRITVRDAEEEKK